MARPPYSQGDLDLIREGFESGFAKIMGPPPEMPPISLSLADTNSPSAAADAVILLHHQVAGFGHSFEEALQEWKSDLATKPQSGSILYWRVLPEVASDKDFTTGKTMWKIYARFGVLE